MTDNDITLLGNILARYLEDHLNWADLIATTTLVLDGMVEVTDQEAAMLRRLGTSHAYPEPDA